MKVKLTRFAFAAAVVFYCVAVAWSRQAPSSAVGTWRGESICTDKTLGRRVKVRLAQPGV